MVANSLVQKKPTFSAFITSDAIKNKVNQMISGKDGDKFITSLISVVSNNPSIAECEHATILSAALLGESLKLSASPQLGQFYIVPFKENKDGVLKRIVATFQIGYKGYIQLAIRSGYYKKLNVLALKKGELKSYNPLEETIDVKIIEDEALREKTESIGYYAMFEYQNGFRKIMYWSKEKMKAHAEQYSQSYRTDLKKGWKYSFWSKDFDEMANKTMLRQLISKWGIMSVELQQAIVSDSAMIGENNEAIFVDNVEDENIIEAQTISQEEISNDDPFNNLEE